ncbi:hypothetical protein CK203_022392 [Vitis vinifera]|uniref:Reverse transcriptase RNase H-like domain-containing protein n=1 Tax=Vitis vinifera TaxID=29760 RepID=A0A438I9L8_VITVI|nr:hypothetical protein CK203_022392 [Vitis vinifera]
MLRWAIELSEYRMKCQPRLALKGQDMADFIAELPQKPSHLTDSPKEGWRSFGGSYLKCLSDLKVHYVLSELHKGVCGNHAGGHTLAHCAHT